MTAIDRRVFLKSSAAVVATAVTASSRADDSSKPRWRKAFMLGGRLTSQNIQDEFQLLKDAGFDGVELPSPNNLDRDAVLRARDKIGLVIHGVSGSRHWQDTLSDPDPAVVERGMAAIRKELDDSAAYGGTTVLVVPAVVKPNVSYRDAYSRSQAAIRKLIPDAEQHKIKLAIEEVWNKFLLSPLEFARYIDEFQSPWVVAYFDVGNVVEFAYPEEWIHELGKRIAKIHIKEYKKEKRFSYKLGEGEINWPAVRQALIDVGYEGWITAEVPKGSLEEMKDVVGRMNRLLGMD